MNTLAGPVSESGRKMWCGPYALAVILGIDYDKAYKKLLRADRHNSGWVLNINSGRIIYRGYKRMYLQGITNYTFQLGAISKYKKFRFEKANESLSLRQYIDNHLRPGCLYVINITGHYVVIDMARKMIIDNHLRRWVPLADTKHMMKCRVKKVAYVCKLGAAGSSPLRYQIDNSFDETPEIESPSATNTGACGMGL